MTARWSSAARASRVLAAGIALVGVLAACSSGGAPSGSTAIASPTAAPPSDSPSAASLEPVEDPAARLEARLLEIMDTPDLAYRFEQSADISSSDASLRQTTTGEVSGQDLHMTLTVTQGDTQTVSEIAILDGTAYQRDASGPWMRSGSTTAAASIVPQLTHVFDQSTMRYAGHELHEASYLQHLTLPTPIALSGDLLRMAAEQRHDGHPGRARPLPRIRRPAVDITYELSFAIQPDASSDPIQLHGVYRSTYIDVGQDIPIQIDGLNLAPV